MEVDMDTLVALVSSKPLVLRIGAEDGAQDLGQIALGDDRKLRISPVAGSPLEGIDPGPYDDRGAAMAAISAHLHGISLHAQHQGSAGTGNLTLLLVLPVFSYRAGHTFSIA
jgi:hypothetical protein